MKEVGSLRYGTIFKKAFEERAQMIEEYHRDEAKRAAFEQGARQALIKTARRLLSRGLDAAMVSQGTGLTEAEVMTLKNKL